MASPMTSPVEDQAFNRLFRLATDDFKASVMFGAYNGRPEASVFSNEQKGAPVIKVLFTETSLYQLKALLQKICKDPEMKPVELGFWPYDQTTKTNIFRSSITIGRDENKCIYLDFSGEKHKAPIRFFLVSDRSIRLNGSELPKQYATELGAEALVDVINNVLSLGANLTRKPRVEGNVTSPSTTSGPSMAGDDVPF